MCFLIHIFQRKLSKYALQVRYKNYSCFDEKRLRFNFHMGKCTLIYGSCIVGAVSLSKYLVCRSWSIRPIQGTTAESIEKPCFLLTSQGRMDTVHSKHNTLMCTLYWFVYISLYYVHSQVEHLTYCVHSTVLCTLCSTVYNVM